MAVFQPPPTWASPILVDEKTKKTMFNPIWLKWFLDLIGVLNASGGGGGGIAHNSTTGLQGGQANEYYHLTAAQHSALSGSVHVGTFTRDMTAASGNVAYTGVGFKPNGVLFFSRVAKGTLQMNSKGFCDSARNFFVTNYTTTGANFATDQGTGSCINIFDAVAGPDTQRAAVVSLDSDGFTLAWVKTNSPTTLATIGYMAIG